MSQKTNIALRYQVHGDPSTALKAEIQPYPVLGDNQVIVQLLASPIHPSDLGMISGSYGHLKTLPAVAGREGVAEVLEVGRAVKGIKPGQWVACSRVLGAWQRYTAIDAKDLVLAPTGISAELASMVWVNPPTALLLLRDFVNLEAGDWVIQNAANSALGHCVIQLAKYRGIRTLNVVRDMKWEPSLKAIGADVVISEESDALKDILELTGGKRPQLGLNTVGGKSVIKLIKVMESGGTVVTLGGMTGELVRFPTRFLIFNDVRLRGFWMDRWVREQSREAVDALYRDVFQLMEDGAIVMPVEKTYPLSEHQEAIAHAQKGLRSGKIFFTA